MKIAFWFESGRREKLHGSGPRDFFYGYHYFQQKYEAELVEDADFPELRRGEWISQLLFSGINRIFRLNADYLLRLLLTENCYKLDRYDWIVATTAKHILAFGILQRMGIFQGKLLAVTTGLVENFEKEWQWKMARWILAKTNVVSLSRYEAKELAKRLGQPVEFLRYGVDEFFWKPSIGSGKQVAEPYILSVGNGRQRDFRLLIDVWRPEWPKLKILTSSRLGLRGKKNIERIRLGRGRGPISNEALRKLYQESQFVVLPLKDTWQPLGQRVALQAMGCGKAVVLALTKGMWDRHVMRHDDNCHFYHAEDKKCLQSSLNLLLVLKKSIVEIEELGQMAAQGIFNIREWSLDLEKYMGLEEKERKIEAEAC